jgi:hypothetical protein
MSNKIESAPVIKERTGAWRYLTHLKDSVRRNRTYTEATIKEKPGLMAVFSYLKENGNNMGGPNFFIQNVLTTFKDVGHEFVTKIGSGWDVPSG